MKIIQIETTLYEKFKQRNRAIEAYKLEAEKDYNEMMGTWIDPSVQEEDDTNE